MQMANAKKGGTPVALANGRSTPGSLKRGPGRPPKKVSFWTCILQVCSHLLVVAAQEPTFHCKDPCATRTLSPQNVSAEHFAIKLVFSAYGFECRHKLFCQLQS